MRIDPIQVYKVSKFRGKVAKDLKLMAKVVTKECPPASEVEKELGIGRKIDIRA